MVVKDVADADDLYNQMQTAVSGDYIRVAPGEYTLEQPLLVPTGVSLGGKSSDPTDWPTTTLNASPSLVGDMITLSDQSSLQKIIIADALRPNGGGSSVAIKSSKPSDSMDVLIYDCRIHNPNEPGPVGPRGPIGRAIAIWNPWENGKSVIRTRIGASWVLCPKFTTGVFAVNFAGLSRILLTIFGCRFNGGGLDAAGGVSRPETVQGAETIIYSNSNFYDCDGLAAGPCAWSLNGGLNAPRDSDGIAPPGGTQFNRLRMVSENDFIRGFSTAVAAVGGIRPYDVSDTGAALGLVSGNTTELRMVGTSVSSAEADFDFVASLAGASDPANPQTAFKPGDANVLRVSMTGVTGSNSTKANRFERVLFNGAAASPDVSGVNNLLQFEGAHANFAKANKSISPGPSAMFFFQ